MAMVVRTAIPGITLHAVTDATMATTAIRAEASTTGAVDFQSGSISKSHQDTGLALLWENLGSAAGFPVVFMFA
jgi:hypothetical protein